MALDVHSVTLYLFIHSSLAPRDGFTALCLPACIPDCQAPITILQSTILRYHVTPPRHAYSGVLKDVIPRSKNNAVMETRSQSLPLLPIPRPTFPLTTSVTAEQPVSTLRRHKHRVKISIFFLSLLTRNTVPKKNTHVPLSRLL